jgi:glutamine synthetase
MPDNKEKAKEYVLKTTKEKGIKAISLWFTDILGFLKSFNITPAELEGALEDGAGFDGSSIEGFARIDESDMIALPDPATYQILPWSLPQYPMARMFCDIRQPGGEVFQGDPRFVMKKNMKRATTLGYTFNVGPELEFFYFKSPETTHTLDEGGYFDLTPPDIGNDLRLETVLTLEQMGITVQRNQHEVASSQHEIDLLYTDALTMADNIMTARLVIKEIAQKHGVYATFMPKPLFGINGSGMHTHMSLFKGNRNAFFDKNDPYYLSRLAKQFAAGLLHHAPEIASVVSQWVNSYKRLVPGYEAPVYMSWARRNRSDMIRVPEYQPGKEKATRIEFRVPDPACNPYLAFSVMLAAGLEGIEKKFELAPPIEENVYAMSAEERDRRGIGSLPTNLFEAVSLTEKSKLVRKTLGDHLFDSFIKNKKIEWDQYRIQVTEYELKRYLPVL